MPESRSRRLKQLERRVEQVAPRKRELFYVRVSRDQYEEVMALLRDLSATKVVRTESTDTPEPFEVQLEPDKIAESPKAVQTEEPDESSDRARLKHLRDLSNASDRRDWHGQNW